MHRRSHPVVHRHRAALVCITASACAAPALAQIQTIEYHKSGIYLQSSNGLPASPSFWTLIARVTTDADDDLTSVDLTLPHASNARPLTRDGHQWLWNSLSFSSPSLLQSNFPDNADYTFSLSGPSASGDAVVTSAAPLFPLDIPHFSGSTYTDLQEMNPNQPFVFTVDGFEQPPAANDSRIDLQIYDLDSGEVVYAASNPTALHSFELPAGTLLPHVNYDVHVTYSARLVHADAYFATASTIAAYDLCTELQFRTRPCIADIDANSAVDLSDFFAFFNCFDAGDPCADIDGNPGIDLGDFFAFFNAFDQSC